MVKVDKVRHVLDGLQGLERVEVLVGIPAAEAPRENEEPEGPINNAALGYIHEHGAPEANIPERPFLIPGIAENEEAIARRMRSVVAESLKGNRGNPRQALEKVGQVAANGVKRKINSGDFTPLSDETLRRRAAKGRKGAQEELDRRAAGEAPGTDLAKPLIDTGQLRNSITYVIR